MLLIYSIMAHLLARLAWRGRGIFAVLADNRRWRSYSGSCRRS